MTVTLDLQFGLNRVFCFRIFAIIKMSIEAVISFQGSTAKVSPSNFTWLLAEFRTLQGTGLRASISCWLLVWGFLQFQRALSSVQFSSVTQSCLRLCDPMNRSTPGLPVHHQLPEFTQTHVYRVSDAIQSSHPLSSPSPPAPNPSQHQSLFQWVNSSHEVAKVLEFQL